MSNMMKTQFERVYLMQNFLKIRVLMEGHLLLGFMSEWMVIIHLTVVIQSLEVYKDHCHIHMTG